MVAVIVLFCCTQLAPPLLVCTMRPLAPAAQPNALSTMKTVHRSSLTPLLCGNQVAPPLLLRRMAPPLPASQPSLALTKSKLLMLFTVTSVVCQVWP